MGENEEADIDSPAWPIAKKFMSMNATRIKNPSQMVYALDHDVQTKSK